MNEIKFGLLDFGYRDSSLGSIGIQIDTIEYAQYADELGFSRYWLSEHYFKKKRAAWTNPEPLIALIAASTRRIKVGSAGMLLGIHQPLHVAGYFKLLNNLFPERIDLGVANGAVSNSVAESAIGPKDDQHLRKKFDQKLKELLRYLRDEESLFEEGIILPPYKGISPEVWSLGVSYRGLERALAMKLNFVRSIFHRGATLAPEREKLIDFKKQFQRIYGIEPRISLAISGCCQATTQEAKKMVSSIELNPDLHLILSIDELHNQILEYQQTFGINEFIFKDIARTSKSRLKTLELISDRFNLSAPSKTHIKEELVSVVS